MRPICTCNISKIKVGTLEKNITKCSSLVILHTYDTIQVLLAYTLLDFPEEAKLHFFSRYATMWQQKDIGDSTKRWIKGACLTRLSKNKLRMCYYATQVAKQTIFAQSYVFFAPEQLTVEFLHVILMSQ